MYVKEIFGMFKSSENIEELWNILLQLSVISATQISNKILNDEIEKLKDPLEIVRYTHLLSMIQEHRYMEIRFEDYEDLDKFMVSENGDNNCDI